MYVAEAFCVVLLHFLNWMRVFLLIRNEQCSVFVGFKYDVTQRPVSFSRWPLIGMIIHLRHKRAGL